jgi:hypothetical protein
MGRATTRGWNIWRRNLSLSQRRFYNTAEGRALRRRFSAERKGKRTSAHAPAANERRIESCKASWTPERRRRQARRLAVWWKTPVGRRRARVQAREQSERLKKNNIGVPMLGDLNPTKRPEVREKMRAAWTISRRRDLSRQMQRGAPLQVLMQRNGNVNRRGKPNFGARAFFDSMSLLARRARSENLSKKLSEKFKGCWNLRATHGFLRTRFGRIRYDSSWERVVLETLSACSNALVVQRDFPVQYKDEYRRRNFLVDFRVELKKGKPLLVETKCPYFLNTENTKRKIRAAKRFCKKNGYRFVLLVSREQVEVWECPKS